MQTACAYIRVSTDDQTEFSPDAQLNAIKLYCKNNSIDLLSEYIFIDAGISGRKAEKRPSFQKMISIAKTKPKPFDLILVHKFDRFARNREDSVVYKSLLRKDCKIKVISITENIDDDKFSIILEAMLEAMAEYYSLNLSEEVKKGMTQKAYKGGVQAAPPFGYDVSNNKYIINKIQAQYVKIIYDKFLNGENLKEISKWLNDNSITTKRGNMFDTRAVEYILNNITYTGKLKWNPNNKISQEIIIKDNCHTPIIDENKFKDVQGKLNMIKEKYSKYQRKSNNSKHFLNGLFKCGNCGKTLSLSGFSYQCNGYTKGLCNISHCLSIKKAEELVDKIFIYDIQKNFKDKNIIIKINDNIKNDSLDNLSKQLKVNQEKLNRVKLAFENGIDNIEEYKNNKNRININIQNIENEIKDINNTKKMVNHNVLQTNISCISNIIKSNNISNEQKHKLIKLFIKKIIFDKTNHQFNVFYNF